MIKSRHISFDDTLRALENEYISSIIRSKIYTLGKDKKHWGKIASLKEEKIKNIGSKKGLNTMFDDPILKDVAFDRVIPIWGFPNFTYNEKFQNDPEKFTFPYSGTIIQVPGGEYGHCDFVNNNKIQVRMSDNLFRKFSLIEVRRLTPLETDMYYYYLPGSKFRVFSIGSGCTLNSVDLNKKTACFNYVSGGVEIENKSSFSEISRMLEL